MRKAAAVCAFVLLAATLLAGNLMSQQPENDEEAAANDVNGIVVAPAPVPMIVWPAMNCQGQIQGFANSLGDLSPLVQWEQTLRQKIATDKQNNQPTPESELNLHRALRQYLSEASLNVLSTQLEQLAQQYPDTPVSLKAKLAVKAMTFAKESKAAKSAEKADAPVEPAKP